MAETAPSKSPLLAGILSGLIPGLGQFYCRQWGKGTGFLLGFLVLDGMLGTSADMLAFMQGAPPHDPGQLLVKLFVLLGLAVWSIADAVRAAKRSS